MEIGKKRHGKCLNIGNCKIANAKKIVEIDSMEDFVCPECHTELVDMMAVSRRKPSVPVIVRVVVVLLLAAGVGFVLLKPGGEKSEITTELDVVHEEGEKQKNTSSPVVVKGISLNTSAVELTVGESQTLTFSIEPADATGKKVSWTSTMPDVVSVDTDGVIKGLLAGNAVIRVTSEDGNFSANCSVTVKKGQVVQASKNELKFSYGRYIGEIRNDKAHGTGTLYFDKSYQISQNDDKNRLAESGDYVTGEFFEGELVQGKWFDKENKQKSTLLIGRSR